MLKGQSITVQVFNFTEEIDRLLSGGNIYSVRLSYV